MRSPVAPQDGFDAIDCSTNEDYSDKCISANSTDFEYPRTSFFIFAETTKCPN